MAGNVKTATIVVIVAVLAGFVMTAEAGGQTTGPRTTPLMIESMYGPDLFKMYCATCHGRDGKGGGPVAEALKVAPPDLTVLSRRKNSVFPARDVEAFITGGTAVAAHGSSEMPVWGLIFRALDPSDVHVKMRIRNLVAHIQSIQQK